VAPSFSALTILGVQVAGSAGRAQGLAGLSPCDTTLPDEYHPEGRGVLRGFRGASGIQSGGLYLGMDCGGSVEGLWNEYGDRAVRLTY
jgi:hypothetical protein